MLGEIIEFFIIKQILKEASTVLCSVVKHLGTGRALTKWEKTLDCVSCFPLHFFRALPRALQQNRAQSRLLYLSILLSSIPRRAKRAAKYMNSKHNAMQIHPLPSQKSRKIHELNT